LPGRQIRWPVMGWVGSVGPQDRDGLLRETDGPGGQVNFAQKVPQADHQGPGGSEKESTDHPGELRFEQAPQKEGRQDGAPVRRCGTTCPSSH